MSRTKHHRTQRASKGGWDYGARYNCNRHYGSPKSPVSKWIADRERRSEDKEVVRLELMPTLDRQE